jgi:hypothetical protein
MKSPNRPPETYAPIIALIDTVRERFLAEGRRAVQSTVALRCVIDMRDAESLQEARAYARDAVAALLLTQVRSPSGKRVLQPESQRAIDLLRAQFPQLTAPLANDRSSARVKTA